MVAGREGVGYRAQVLRSIVWGVRIWPPRRLLAWKRGLLDAKGRLHPLCQMRCAFRVRKEADDGVGPRIEIDQDQITRGAGLTVARRYRSPGGANRDRSPEGNRRS